MTAGSPDSLPSRPFSKGHLYWIAVAYFLFAAAPGSWYPVLSNVLEEAGLPQVITWAFLLGPISGMISPLLFAAKADQVIPAEKLLAALVGGGMVFLFLAFEALERGWGGGWFLFFLAINSLITVPGWSLLNSVAFANLPDPDHQFGRYRVWGTIGWMVAGLLVSVLGFDGTPATGKMACMIRLLACGVCFLIPHTPPGGKPARDWLDVLGLRAFGLLRERNLAAYMLTAFLFTIPISAYYMHTPLLMVELGSEKVAGGMTLAQFAEIFAMLAIGALITRWRIKWLLLLAIGCGVMRYASFAFAAEVGALWPIFIGLVLNGVCWAFFFEAGRVVVNRIVSGEFRAQAQALLGFIASGLGGLAGTWVSGALYDALVATGEDWVLYWSVQTAFCLLCGVVFFFGYKSPTK